MTCRDVTASDSGGLAAAYTKNRIGACGMRLRREIMFGAVEILTMC